MATLDFFQFQLEEAAKQIDAHVNYWQLFLKDNICSDVCTDQFVHEIMLVLGTYTLF